MDTDLLDTASASLDRAATAHHRARAAYHAAIATELRNGTRQAELARHTGYTREQIRRIARAAGIGPARAQD